MIALVCSSIILGGCTQQNTPNDNTDDTTKPTTEAVEQILRKAQIIDSIYYEVNTTETADGTIVQNVEMKIWQKTPYLKENVSFSFGGNTLNVSYIQRPNGTFQYEANKNKYVLYPEIVLPQRSTANVAADLLDNQSITILGTETVDGKTATVIQYTTDQPENSTTMKMWIWNDRGVTLKVQETRINDGITFRWVSVYQNYSFIDIPESTFDIS